MVHFVVHCGYILKWKLHVHCTILNSLLLKGCTGVTVWLIYNGETSTRIVINLVLFFVFEFLSMAMTFLLGYVKTYAEECYEECQAPRKLLILVICSFVSLGQVGSAVMKKVNFQLVKTFEIIKWSPTFANPPSEVWVQSWRIGIADFIGDQLLILFKICI